MGELMEKKLLTIFGASGLVGSSILREALDKGYYVNGTLRDVENKDRITRLKNLPSGKNANFFSADMADISSLDKNRTLLINGLGNIPNTKSSNLNKRALIYTNFKKLGYSFKSIISPDAIISDKATIKEGCQIISSAVVNSGVTIGENCIINTSATIDHNCKIGFNTHIAPGAIVCGGVVIGASCHIGAGATIIPGVEISDGAVIGAGAVVLNNVSENETVVGNPAKII